MKTLIPASFNWPAFLLASVIIRLIGIQMAWTSYLAILISLYQFILLFRSIGYIIPTRHLLGAFMCIQFFVGPSLAYNGLDQYQYFAYTMKIPETEYFIYALPAVIAFIIGLHLRAGNYKGEIIDQKKISFFVAKHPSVPYFFIVMGFFVSVLSNFFSSELAFVFYLLGSFKFIGMFLLVLGKKRIQIGILVLVIGSIISSSLGNGMFHDLLTWAIYSAAVFGVRYRFNFKIKMIGLSAFILIALTIQVLKGSYRSEIGNGEGEGSAETFSNLVQEKNDEGGIFNTKSLAESNVRINQGFIITNIMYNVPNAVPFANGEEMYQILEAAILPRFLAPNKLRAGDRKIFVKYSNIGLTAGTSMGLSSLGDAYINWGIAGGIIFMFVLGLFYCWVLNQFFKFSSTLPILILFTSLVFYYPIRPDCELQTILGHLFKSCLLIMGIMYLSKNVFTTPRYLGLKKQSSLS